jgi:hypothetical protein
MQRIEEARTQRELEEVLSLKDAAVKFVGIDPGRRDIITAAIQGEYER